jgi:kynurenine formamidase
VPGPDYTAPGALARLTPAHRRAALALVERGWVYDLEVTRFPFMPGAAAHPPWQLVTYRTPQGERVDRTPAWMDQENVDQIGFLSELVIGSLHTGTHIDALAHFTRGPADAWYGGVTADAALSDFGPRAYDVTTLPPIITRGVLLDIAAVEGVDCLPAGFGIGPAACQAALHRAGVTLQEGDAVLLRTGWMTRWPDPVALEAVAGAGLNEAGARWLAQQGVVLMGADTPGFEQNPSADPRRPRVVHPYCLIDAGIPIMELLDLEALARDQVYVFALIVSPLKIRGGTASLVRPLALI